jgi:hypothetical protein
VVKGLKASELLAKGSTNQTSKEDSFYDLEALENFVGLIRGGYRLDTDSWLRLLQEIQAVWPVASKGRFRLWKVSGFPSLPTNL